MHFYSWLFFFYFLSILHQLNKLDTINETTVSLTRTSTARLNVCHVILPIDFRCRHICTVLVCFFVVVITPIYYLWNEKCDLQEKSAPFQMLWSIFSTFEFLFGFHSFRIINRNDAKIVAQMDKMMLQVFGLFFLRSAQTYTIDFNSKLFQWNFTFSIRTIIMARTDNELMTIKVILLSWKKQQNNNKKWHE